MDSIWYTPPSAIRLDPTTLDHDQVSRGLFGRARNDIVTLVTGHKCVEAVGLIRKGRAIDSVTKSSMVLLITGNVLEEDWPGLQQQIRQILDRHGGAAGSGIDLPIELFRAEMELLAQYPNRPVHMGDAMSVTDLPWAAGSVGGFVRLDLGETALTESDPRRAWRNSTFALTCHHVVRPTRIEQGKVRSYPRKSEF